jgi:hypothetical protein
MDPKKVAAAQAAKAEMEAAKQAEYKEKIVSLISRDTLTDPLTHQVAHFIILS